ncbi:MAG: putative collagen-binding domain-containing protein, partial [Pseudomonadota bacterium]
EDSGTLDIAPTDKTGDDFRAKGMILQAEGEHFLQYQGDGDYFVRGGPGVPENFLANGDFDGANLSFASVDDPNPGGGNLDRHQFANHVDDYDGDGETWDGGKGEAVLGAVNYLADQGMNTIYLLTNTVAGDGQDVSPWVDEDLYKVDKHTKSIEEAARDTSGVSTDAFSVYDVSKLDQWETVFDHMDDKGIYKNILFQETENDQLLNGGTSVEGSTLSVERLVYMREMIARFGHANGVQWNMGEENTQDDDERLDMANWIKAVDPYDHLVVIHTFGSDYDDVYGSLLGDEAFDGPSFQTGAGSIRNLTTEWRADSAANGDPWVIAWDEDSGNNAKVTAYETDADNPNEQTLREGMWGHLTAGGSGVNWYLKGNGFGAHSFDQNLDDFEGFESIWTWTRAATEFYNEVIPFWEMTQNDGLTPDRGDFVSAKAGEYYVAYLPYGEATDVEFDLLGQDGQTFDVFWYDPRNGGDLIA